MASDESPKAVAVPEPVIKNGKIEADKVKDGLTEKTPADIGLIKTEKKIIDKNCRMIGGQVKCGPKNKRIKRKTIE